MNELIKIGRNQWVNLRNVTDIAYAQVLGEPVLKFWLNVQSEDGVPAYVQTDATYTKQVADELGLELDEMPEEPAPTEPETTAADGYDLPF